MDMKYSYSSAMHLLVSIFMKIRSMVDPPSTIKRLAQNDWNSVIRGRKRKGRWLLWQSGFFLCSMAMAVKKVFQSFSQSFSSLCIHIFSSSSLEISARNHFSPFTWIAAFPLPISQISSLPPADGLQSKVLSALPHHFSAVSFLLKSLPTSGKTQKFN